MKAKRLLSMVLAFCLAVSLLPGLSLSASAANTVSYTRYTGPEVAILNARTGASTKFYESIFKNANYNAVQAGYFKLGSEALKYDTENGKNRTYTWSNFVNTQLAFFSDQTQQIQVNYSTTLKNNIHEHSWKKNIFSKYVQECYGRMAAQLWFNGAGSGLKGTHYAAQYSDYSKKENVRKGDRSYAAMPEVFKGTQSLYYMINGEYVYDWGTVRSDLNLTFTNLDYLYDGGNKTCTCGGWANNHVVTFYDGEAPYVRSVETRRNGVVTTDFKPGDVIEVVLKMSEPIRFADDSASGKENVCIALLVNGSTTPRYASLTALESSGTTYWNPHNGEKGSAVYALRFAYQVPTTQTGIVNITGVDLTKAPTGKTALVHSEADVALKQVKGNSSFTVSKPSDVNSGEGFNVTKSYVTDMAGNALLQSCPGTNFTIDAERPFVAQIVLNAALNNDAVKADKDPADANWIDNSDRYLGVGDSFTLDVYLNEVVSYDLNGASTIPDIATATLNLLDASENPVTVPLYLSRSADAATVGTQYGLGASGGKVSLLRSSGEVRLQDGMHLPDGATAVAVSSISYDPAYNVCDASGNIARDEAITDAENHLTPTGSYLVDTVGPAVSIDDVAQNAPNERFSVAFTVNDNAGGSGVEDMAGSVRLLAGSGEGGAYQYAVSIDAMTDGETVWKDARFGDAMPFTEFPGAQYLHVRPVSGETFNLNGLTARFTLSDYAGNRVDRDADLSGVILDTVGPSLRGGLASRAYENVGDSGRGVMTVPVTARDDSGLKTVSYLWADADSEITAESAGWENLTFTQGETEVQQDLTVYVANSETFSKTLWLMAEDVAGNRTLEKKNAYSYSLAALVYHIEYSTGVTAEASIKTFEDTVTDEDGVLIFDVRKAGDVDENDAPIHYINVCMQGGLNNGLENAFGAGFCWYRATLDESSGRTFTLLPDQGDGIGLISDYLSGYNGEIEVTVYSGKINDDTYPAGSIHGLDYFMSSYGGYRWAWDEQAETGPISLDNSVGVEKFTLRVVAASDNRIANADSARIQCEFTYVDPMFTNRNPQVSAGSVTQSPYSVFAAYGYTANKSLAGAVLSFTLTDTYGWDFDDIDWDNSYLRLSNYAGDWWEADSTAVRVCGIGKGASQTVVVPACELPSGRYDYVKLVLARFSCPDDPYWWYVRGDGKTGHDNYLIGGESYVNLTVDVDSAEAGSVQPGLLSYQPYYKLFNSEPARINMEMNQFEFPRRLIEYDPNDVIYIPAGLGRVDMMFQVLDPEGNPALRKGFVTNYNMNFGQYDVVAWNVADPTALTYLQCDSETDLSGSGYFAKGYNENYCFRLNDEGKIERWTNAGEEGGQLCLTFTMGERNTVYDYYGGYARQLRLTPDQDNVIAVQARYLNGETSDVVYLTVHPVSPAAVNGTVTVEPEPEDEDANHPWGTIVGAPGEVAFRYTPAEGELTAGLTFWLCEGYSYFMDAVIDGMGYSSGSHLVAANNAVEMTQMGDGSYLAWVPEQDVYHEDAQGGLPHYLVIAEDAMGNLTALPGPQNSVLTDSSGPRVDVSEPEVDDTGSTFVLWYYIEDEALMANVSRWINGNALAVPTGGPLTLTFTVDEDYAAILGAASFTLTYDPAEAEETGTVTYVTDSWPTRKTVVTQLPVEGNGLGISAVTATLETAHDDKSMIYGMNRHGSLVLTVEGGISPKLTTPTDVTLTLSAADCYGNSTYTVYANIDGVVGDPETVSSSATTVLHDAVGEVPHFVSAEYKLTGSTTYGCSQDRALYMTFSGPVRPAESWICPNPTGYAAEWHDAFPIWKDGEWEISYYDMNDVLRTETITLTDVFGEYGVELDFSTLDYTTEPVVISASLEGTDEYGHSDCMALLPYPADGQSFETVKNGASEVSREVTQNGAYVLLRSPYSGNPGVNFTDQSFRDQYADYLTIYVSNYVNGRPDEDITLFFYENGREYVAGAPDQRTGETDDMVTIAYRTARPTQAVGNGETSKTFRAGEDDSFSFTYYDPVTDTEYTISGTLSGTYGVTLVAPVDPPADETAPNIGRVSVWRQMGSRFEQAEAFRGDADDATIRTSIDNAGLGQGFDLVVTATDASAWRLALCDEEPTSLTYGAENAEIPGVSIQGNNVLITSEIGAYTGDAFWVAAVDEHGNFSYFKLMKSWFNFDTTAPVLICSDAQIPNFYERTVFLRATDTDDAGNDTSEGVTAVGDGLVANDGSNADFPAAEWPWMITFTQNTTGSGIPVTATDSVGNYAMAYVTVEGIDDSVPTLSVTWSPCFRDSSGLDQSQPTMGPVNVDVVAHITSDKSIANAEGVVTVTAPAAPAYSESYDLPYGVPSSGGWNTDPVSYDFTDKMVTVYFTSGSDYLDVDGDGYYDGEYPVAYHVALKVYAPNRGCTEAILDLAAGVLDKEAPYVANADYTYLYRQREDGSDYDLPYAYRAEITFSEDVYLNGDLYEGSPGELHRASEVFSYYAYDDDHVLTMTDKAGNVATEVLAPSAPAPVDNAAPTFSIINEDELAPVGSTAVTVKIRIDDEIGVDESDISVSDPTKVSITAFEVTTDSEGIPYGLLTLSVTANGTYRLTATDYAGNVGSMIFGISNLDRTLPTIRFATSTITVLKGTGTNELQTLLREGVTLWDNVDGADALRARLSFDASVVNLNVPGVYQVTYNVTDSAGNVGEAVRLVRVLSDKLPEIRIDGELTELNGTFSLKPGSHTLSVSNLGSATEPYTVKLVKGIWSEGQLKYVTVGIPVGTDGSFTLSAEGFYTLYLQTQSRISYRTMLYAAN